ncbi:hypothetical protein OEA41_005870 [Lepraria neglecta]|uniref:Uncharacterized protein n=1 Tax=Lepraria neglecta TaxID=209136 RepID=A0AAD9Z9D0_9LECA|nr:hypothetical protein OEA41_005870 [Lepraria neglecta]
MVTNGGLEEMSLTDEDEEHEDSNNEADENKIISGSPKTNDRLLREKSIQFEACAAFSSGSHDIAKNLGMKVFEIKDPGHIGRDKRSPWVSRITMEAISQEISEIDGRSPESVYELLRTVFLTARPGWNLPEWRQEAPISFRRIARLKAIEKSLDDTTKKTKYEGGVESEPATEPWQLASQRCEESRKRRNEHVRANYNGLDIDARNSKIEWQKEYRRRHGEESNRKRREKRAKECDAAGVKKEKGEPRGSYSKSAKDFRELKATQEQQQQQS